jgi:ribosomal protein L2
MIIRVERDIMRTALLGVVCYANGIVSYILMPESLNIGDFVLNSSLFSNNKIG